LEAAIGRAAEDKDSGRSVLGKPSPSVCKPAPSCQRLKREVDRSKTNRNLVLGGSKTSGSPWFRSEGGENELGKTNMTFIQAGMYLVYLKLL
jgi:hypothetical protein